ncbi:MAG: ComEC/Rec2 family competence protein [Gammaproteobacteria bacterium]|nr:ComEC/Rec2 family competence protein [Gammaproteobacteria bacterium]
MTGAYYIGVRRKDCEWSPPMRMESVLFLSGILILVCIPELPSRNMLWLFPACLCLLSSRWYLRWPAWVLAGLLYAHWRALGILSVALDPAVEGSTVTVQGRVASLPERKGDVTRFSFRLDAMENEGLPPGALVRLRWYLDAPQIVPGERWRLRVRLKRPVGFMNPGSFDYEAWLFQHRIRATGYVVGDARNGRVDVAHPWRPDVWRFHLRERIHAALPEGRFRALIVALALGDQSAILPAEWDLLNRTGTNHLLAISGLHISLVAVAAMFGAAWLWPRLGRAALVIPAPWVGAAVGFVAATLYCALAGFSIPTQRSMIMILTGLGATVFRPAGLARTLALALLAVLLFDPFSVLAPGFWLSFLAVAWIGWGMHGRLGAGSPWDRWGRVQGAVSLGLVPVLAFWFQQVSIAGVIANLVAIPWVSFVTVPLVLIGSLLLWFAEPLGAAALQLADGTLAWLWPFLELVGGHAFAMLKTGPISPAAVIAAGVGAALLLLPPGMPGRWLGWLWMLPLFVPASAAPPPGTLRVTLLDVGQGLAAVIRTSRHTLLYDTGPAFGPDFNAGEAVIVPWLRQAGVRSLDVLVQSHGDRDHIGGLASVREAVPVERILTGVPDRVRGEGVSACRAGQKWTWDGYAIEMLHPREGDRLEGNNASCVLRITNLRNAVLLTGDIEREAEELLVRRFGSEMRATILIVPHHGSSTSSTPEFVASVQPGYAAHPAGYRNRYGFPKPDIMSRYQQHGAINLDTGRYGALEFVLDDARVRFSAHRVSARRFWHTRLL